MDITIVSDKDKEIKLSNGDVVYEGTGIFRGKWWIGAKSRRAAADEYYRDGVQGCSVTPGAYKPKINRTL